MRYVHSIIGDTPWLQFGDFNVVRQMSERLVGFDCNSALEFNYRLDCIEMDDMPFKGLLFMWSNKRGGMGHIKSKLDRVLINGPGWMPSLSRKPHFWHLEFLIIALFWWMFFLQSIVEGLLRSLAFA